MLESSYNPKAVSHANAAGLWQLIPATAKRFGLTINTKQDDRFDTEASTTAALGPDVYAVGVSFAGDGYYLACASSADTLVTVQAAGAKITLK